MTKKFLIETHPLIAKYMVEDEDKFLTHGSKKKVEWFCDRGHTWFAAVYNCVRPETAIRIIDWVKPKGESDDY